jgi:hypothetical protein
MFEHLMQKREEKKEEANRQKEKNFLRESDILNSAMNEQFNPDDLPEARFDMIKWQQDLHTELEQIKRRLKREIYINGEWQKEQILIGYDSNSSPLYVDAPPLMNERGISKFIMLLKPLISKGLMMSNYSERLAFQKLKRVHTKFVLDLRHNHKNYDIRKRDLPYIVQLFKDIADPTQWRSLNNGERKYLTTTYKSIEAKSEQITPEIPKKGLLKMV